MRKKRSQKRPKAYQKNLNRRGNDAGKKRRRQRGSFLNRYDFAYTGRDTVSQVGKIAPGIIKQTIGQIDKIAQDRIN